MFISVCYLILRRVLELAALHGRSNDFKELEIVVLRHELAVLRRRIRRPAMTWSDRLFLTAASRLLPRAQWRSFILTPATTVLMRYFEAAGSRSSARRFVPRKRMVSQNGSCAPFARSVLTGCSS